MAIYHVDLVNGDDANDGSTWALAKKTINSISILIDDLVKVAKNFAPVNIGSALWTKDNSNVVLASARTLEIHRSAGSTWTPVAPTTGASDTKRKIGTNAQRLVINAAQTGKIGYVALPSTVNLSTFTKLCFWFQHSQATYFPAGGLILNLCSDATGDVPVHSLDLYGALGDTRANEYSVALYDNIVGMSATINSISITKTNAIAGALTIVFNHFLACNDLTLQSIIGVGEANTEFIYDIQSIDGVNIVLDKSPITSAPNTTTYFLGETNNYTTYISNGIAHSPIEVGNILNGNLATITGGYNTVLDEVDGFTHIFCGSKGALSVINASVDVKNFIFSSLRQINDVSNVGQAQKRFINTVFTGIMYGGLGSTTYPDGYGFVNCIIASCPAELTLANSSVQNNRPVISYINGLQIINSGGTYTFTIGQDGGVFKNISFKGWRTNALRVTGSFNLIDTVTFDRVLGTTDISVLGTNNTMRNPTGRQVYTGYNSKHFDSGTIPTKGNYGMSFFATDLSATYMYANPMTRAYLDYTVSLPDGTLGAWKVGGEFFSERAEMLHGLKICEAFVEANKFIVARLFFKAVGTLDQKIQLRAMRDNNYGIIEADVINEVTVDSLSWVEYSISFVSIAAGLVVIDLRPLQTTEVFFGQFSITVSDL